MAASVDENVPSAAADAAKHFVWTRSMTDMLLHVSRQLKNLTVSTGFTNGSVGFD